MSAQMPEIVDAWRMVATRSRLEGRLALSSMPRLSDALADTDSVDAVCSIEFGQDALQTAFAELRIEAEAFASRTARFSDETAPEGPLDSPAPAG